MSETREVIKVEQAEGVDLATVKGIVLPSRDVTPMTKFHKLNIQHLQFLAERGHKVGWKDGQDLFIHANHQLDAIFVAAGAEVLVNEVVTSDDQGDPLPANVFRHHFAAKIILPSGKVAQADCHKTWDLRSMDDAGTRAMASFRRRQKQLERALAGAKGAKWPKVFARKGAEETAEEFWDRANIFLESVVEDEMIERRVFGGELAEAGAKSRAVYDMTGLKMGVSKEEFEQPIWVVTSLFNAEEALQKIAGTTEGQQVLALMALASNGAFGAMVGEVIPGGAEALKLLQAVQNTTPGDIEKAMEEATEDAGEEPAEEENLSQEIRDGGPLEETIEMAVEIQPPDEDEPAPADVQVLIDEMMAEKAGMAKEGEVSPRAEDLSMDPVEEALRVAALKPKETRPITDNEREAFTKYLIWCGYGRVKWGNLLKTLFGRECTMGTVSKLQAKIACQYVKYAKDETASGIHDKKMLKAVKDGRKVMARQAYETGRDIDEYLKWMQSTEE